MRKASGSYAIRYPFLHTRRDITKSSRTTLVPGSSYRLCANRKQFTRCTYHCIILPVKLFKKDSYFQYKPSPPQQLYRPRSHDFFLASHTAHFRFMIMLHYIFYSIFIEQCICIGKNNDRVFSHTT